MTRTLAEKLAVRVGVRVDLVHAPRGFAFALPPGATLHRTTHPDSKLILAFFVRRALLEREIEDLASVVVPSGALWVAWPKRASGVASDLGDQSVREIVLSYALVDNKVCAIDDTWSALRFVRRTA